MDAEPADKTPLVNRPLRRSLIRLRTPTTAPLISPTISLPDDQNQSSSELDVQNSGQFLVKNTSNPRAYALSLRLLNYWLAISGSSKPASRIECGDRRILWALARIASRIECADKRAKPHIPADQLEGCSGRGGMSPHPALFELSRNAAFRNLQTPRTHPGSPLYPWGCNAFINILACSAGPVHLRACSPAARHSSCPSARQPARSLPQAADPL